MGKRLVVQRRGKGSPRFKAATHKRIAPAKYPPFFAAESIKGMIKDLLHEPGRGAPLGLIKLEDGSEFYTPVPEGASIGQTIVVGERAPIAVGNITSLGNIPEGTLVCNIEGRPGSGGDLARSSGSYASIVAHTLDGTKVKLPSGKTVYLNDKCRATIGVVAGAGRTERVFLKAGKKHHLMRAKGRSYPRVRGVAMNPVYHPFGGGRQHKGKPTVVSRHAPPGRKVGLIAARSTGKRSKKLRRVA